MKHLKSYLDSELMTAVKDNNINKIKELITSGVDLDKQDQDGNIALIDSVDNIEMVRLLIDSGVNLDIQNSYGYSALIWACRNENFDSVKLLIGSGANLDLKNIYLDTALSISSYEEPNMNIIRELIKAGADWNIEIDDNGDTFLDILDDNYKKEIIEEFPNEYQIYLVKRDSKKYNL